MMVTLKRANISDKYIKPDTLPEKWINSITGNRGSDPLSQ